MREYLQYLNTFYSTKYTDVRLWIKSHRGMTIGILILGIFGIQYLFLPNYRLQSLRFSHPDRTALMQQRLEQAEAEGSILKITRTIVPYSRISPHLIHAVIVSEDGRFFEHEGVDWYEIGESIEKNIEKGKAARGGSTISQQLVKNLYLTTSKDPVRKFKELIVTIRMERYLSKRRILELYLNNIEWGKGIFGVEAASRKYFNKPSAQLTRQEAAQMAAVIPSPLRHTPVDNSRYVSRRTSIILSRMSARGY